MRDFVGGLLFMAGAKMMRRETLRTVIKKVQPETVVNVKLDARSVADYLKQMRRAGGLGDV